MTDYDRDECLDMLETIEEQLAALPHKKEEVKDQLQVIAQAKRLKYPIANLYANMWTERGRRARASRELVSSLHLNPDLGQGLEPGRDVYRCVDVDPFGTVKLSGTVNEDGVIRVLDVARQNGETIDRDAWMGSHHDYFALLLAHQAYVQDQRENNPQAVGRETLPTDR